MTGLGKGQVSRSLGRSRRPQPLCAASKALVAERIPVYRVKKKLQRQKEKKAKKTNEGWRVWSSQSFTQVTVCIHAQVWHPHSKRALNEAVLFCPSSKTRVSLYSAESLCRQSTAIFYSCDLPQNRLYSNVTQLLTCSVLFFAVLSVFRNIGFKLRQLWRSLRLKINQEGLW